MSVCDYILYCGIIYVRVINLRLGMVKENPSAGISLLISRRTARFNKTEFIVDERDGYSIRSFPCSHDLLI